MRVSFLIAFISVMVGSAAGLNLDWYTPTLANASTVSLQNYTSHTVLNVTGNALSTANYTWNGSNFSLYDSSLILFYSLDNVSALGDTPTVAVDVSLSKNNGIISGGYFASGKYGYGLQFDGINDFLNTTYNQNHTSGTWAVWVKSYTQTGGYDRILSAEYNLTNFGTKLTFGGDLTTLIFTTTNTTGNKTDLAPSGLSLLNAWNHVVGVWNTTYMAVYVNGVNKASSNIVGARRQGGLIIGNGNYAGSSDFFNGTMDDVKVFNRALSASEVQQLYLTGLRKLDNNTWDLSVLNVPATAGTYTYKASASDSLGFSADSPLYQITFTGGNNWITNTSNYQGMCIQNESIPATTYTCYQETANAEPACGGLNTGSYTLNCLNYYSSNCSFMYDGNQDTFNVHPNATFYITYSTPSNALTSSLWQVHDSSLPTNYVNLSIPSDCWSSTTLQFNLTFFAASNCEGIFPSSIYYYCKNETSWVLITNRPQSTCQAKLYEEGVYWVMQNASYNYTLQYYQEENGLPYSFASHGVSYLDVVCPNYGTDRIDLARIAQPFSFYTREKPILNSYTDSGSQFRSLAQPVNGSLSVYLLDGNNIPYTLNRLDYSQKWTDSVLNVQSSINNTLQTVHSSIWLDGVIHVSLANNTPYKFTLTNPVDGSVREFGFISLQPYDTSKDFVINDVSLNDKNFKIFDDLTYAFSVNDTLGRMELKYNKSAGLVTKVTYNITNVTGGIIYSTSVSSTANGILTYIVPNITQPYFQTAVFQLPTGYNITVSDTSIVINGSFGVNLFPSGDTTIFNVRKAVIMNMLSMFILTGLSFAGTVWNPEVGLLVVGLGVVFDRFGWLTGIPWWLWSLLFIMALGMKLAHRRDVP